MKERNAKSTRTRNLGRRNFRSSAGRGRTHGKATSDVVLGTRNQAGPNAPVNRKWAWHQRVLLKMRDRLTAGRDQHRREGGGQTEVRHTHLADSGTDEFDHELALGELSANQDALYEVEDALRRIASGTYGLCEETGKPISPARLRAVPWTRFSRQAESRREQEKTSHRSPGPLGSARRTEPGIGRRRAS